jgi:FLVCR family MFS transporter 7
LCAVVSSEFRITLDQVNWLGNIVAVIYLPSALLVPHIVSHYGIRICVRDSPPPVHLLLKQAVVSNWRCSSHPLLMDSLLWHGAFAAPERCLRFADTGTGEFDLANYQRSLNEIFITCQFFASIAQPLYQVLSPIYSETWFDLNGRTTATMILGICWYPSPETYLRGS